MTEAIAVSLLKLLLAEAPGVVLAVLRAAGLIDDSDGYAPIEKMRRASDVLVTNPMVKARRERVAWPDEYDKPESD